MTPKLLTAERFIDMRSEISYRYVLSDTEYFRPHYHDYFELFLMLDGSAVHFVNGDEIKLSKGTAVFVRPNDTHDFVCKNGKTFSMLNITFTQARCWVKRSASAPPALADLPLPLQWKNW